MHTKLSQAKPNTPHFIQLTERKGVNSLTGVTADERKFIDTRLKAGVKVVPLFKNETLKIIAILPGSGDSPERLEQVRLIGHQVCQICNELKIPAISVHLNGAKIEGVRAFCEGLVLTSYEFAKYKTGKTKSERKSLKKVHFEKKAVPAKTIRELNAVLDAVCKARDLVNEPLSYLTASRYSSEIRKAGKSCGFKVTVYTEKRIRQMKMGGILAVNKGSTEPPTFNIMEFKPTRPVNKNPVVLVGKGVVYDTGGLSLKPTKNSMDKMKSDMAGSAVVVGAMMALARNKLNLHVIGLIPAVENRPGGNAYVPGDVITMYDGTTVEVMNTDAEGRLILADALAYAKSLDPMLVIDFATLTGSAARAVGPHGIAWMTKCESAFKEKLRESAERTRERVVEFPLWKEYGEMLDSPIADLTNLGGASAGAITAGKFLEHFTDYPWMHFDIAGVAYIGKELNYRGTNGTGTGVRLAYEFLKNLSRA